MHACWGTIKFTSLSPLASSLHTDDVSSHLPNSGWLNCTFEWKKQVYWSYSEIPRWKKNRVEGFQNTPPWSQPRCLLVDSGPTAEMLRTANKGAHILMGDPVNTPLLSQGQQSARQKFPPCVSGNWELKSLCGNLPGHRKKKKSRSWENQQAALIV